MNEETYPLLKDEIQEFSSRDWGKNGEYIFSSICLSLKKDGGEWYLKHNSAFEVIVDSTQIHPNNLFHLTCYEHFIQIKDHGIKCLLLFVPKESSITLRDKVPGAYIRAERYTRIFSNKKSVSGIENLTFTIRPSEFVGIFGESGIGKSVLINSILGTIHDGKNNGLLSIENEFGEKIQKNEISYLPQVVDIPQFLSCREILHAAIVDRASMSHSNDDEVISSVLKRCSLDDSILNKRYRFISEGQKRRLCIAATLLKKHAKILIADEPTTGLDAYSEEQVMETLRSISRSGITVLVVTHSVISAQIMDRVLVLKKINNDHGAMISYDGPISRDQLDIISRVLRDKSDKTKIESNSGYLFPEIIQYKTTDKEESTNHKINVVSKTLLFQLGQWFLNILNIICRDRKSILIFGTMAFVCVLTIQFGVDGYALNNVENILLTLFSLAAPWLCAMYAAICVSELSRYYAWEHFSGLRSLSFLFGCIFAHIVPALFVALIFTGGLFFAPRNGEIVKNGIVCRGVSKETPKETISKRLWFVREEDKTKMILNKDRGYIRDCINYAVGKKDPSHSQFYTPLKTGTAKSENGEPLYDKTWFYSPLMTFYNNLTPGVTDNYPLAQDKTLDIPKSTICAFLKVLLIMCLSSWIGSIIGITSAIVFANAKNAAVFIVVLFIFYILFSRIFISTQAAQSYLQPLAEISENKLTIEFRDMGVIIPILFSFVCLGRYTSNLVAYTYSSVSLFYDYIALFGIVFLCLLLSFVALNKKNLSK